jgi:hypothetical protein
MKSEFLLVSKILRRFGDCPDGKTHDAEGFAAMLAADPEFAESERSVMEHHWRNRGYGDAEQLIHSFVGIARYLSDVIGGDVPILAPRDVIDSSIGIRGGDSRGELLIGKSIIRAIRSQTQATAQLGNQALLEEIGRLLRENAAYGTPPASKYLTTKQVAEHLELNTATVERKFRVGELDGDKTGGKQWRTTADRLMKSPYMRKKQGTQRDVEVE